MVAVGGVGVKDGWIHMGVQLDLTHLRTEMFTYQSLYLKTWIISWEWGCWWRLWGGKCESGGLEGGMDDGYGCVIVLCMVSMVWTNGHRFVKFQV